MASGWIKGSARHLDQVGEDYFQHQRFAFHVGASLVVAGLACILHSLVPALFTDKASRTIGRLHRLIHHRSDFAEPLRSEGSPFPLLAALSLCCSVLPWIAGAQALIALPLTLLSLGFPIAYGWSEDGQGSAIELLLPLRLED